MKDFSEYEDILHHAAPKPRHHKQMPMGQRAAQFLPFAALTGYEGLLEESAGGTTGGNEMSEEERAKLDEDLQWLVEKQEKRPEIRIILFVEDEAKEGGRYETITGRFRCLNDTEGYLQLTSRKKVQLAAVRSLEILDPAFQQAGQLFENE
jgi:hypothetical protein